MQIDFRMRRLLGIGNTRFAHGRFHREELQALAIEQQLEIVRLAQSLDVLVAIARQPNLDLVLAILWKGVMDQRTASGPDRQAVDVLFLRDVGGHADRFAAGRFTRATDGHPADLFRRRDVTIQECRREIADGHVVESIAGFIGRQERRHVDVQCEQIPDRVLVLGSRQTAEGRRASRIRLGGSGAIERLFEERDDGVVRGIVRPFFPDRRHQSGAKLANDLLPHVRMLRDVLGGDRLQHEAALFMILVVAGEAEIVDQCDLWAGRRGMRWRGMSCRVIRSGQVRRPNRRTADEQERRNRARDGTPVKPPRGHTPQ